MAKAKVNGALRPVFKTFVEGISLITATGFVLSGFVNAWVFQSNWRLNYFTIAQPADVVMSGFIYITVIVAIVAIVSFSLHVVNIDDPELTIAEQDFVDKKRKSGLSDDDTDQALSAYRAKSRRNYFIASIFAGLFALFIILQTNMGLFSHRMFLSLHDLLSGNPRSSSHIRELASSDLNELVLAPSEPSYKDCGAAPVLWLGSTSAIINCKGKIRILHNPQGLTLDRAS